MNETSGEEIRSIMNEEVASLYWDLDGGFSHEAWLLPSWLPLPSFRYALYLSNLTARLKLSLIEIEHKQLSVSLSVLIKKKTVYM